ncbi:hypothetical protein SB781_40965, partial [Paraburkholderia sp. SIMBA_061]
AGGELFEAGLGELVEALAEGLELGEPVVGVVGDVVEGGLVIGVGLLDGLASGGVEPLGQLVEGLVVEGPLPGGESL